MIKSGLTVLARLELLLEVLAGVVFLFTTFLVGADALGRYIFNAPIRWSTEVIALYLLPAVFFLVLPISFARNAHVAVDVAMQHAHPALRVLSRLLVHLAGACFFVLLLYFNAGRLWQTYTTQEVVPGVILWSLWPSLLIVCVGVSLAAARCIANFLSGVALVCSGRADAVGDLRMANGHAAE
ncbi:MAG TPA: TRAP transporter small permease [Ramlibacter sp.]|nr:TRAP transporter small permease [Ramlibacter sp.]